ncbi:MAG: glycine cleavage system protein H [Holophagae bacterium]
MRRLDDRFGGAVGQHVPPVVEIIVPRTLFFHPGHGWARLDEDGTITVGIDDLLRTLISEVSSVDLPTVGEPVVVDQPIVRVGCGGRTLRVRAPISGRVIEINRQLGRDPSRLRWRPYKEGWACRLAPGDRLADELGDLVIGAEAERWMARDIRRVDEMFRTGLLEPPIEGALGRAPEPVWTTLERELLWSDGDPGRGV